MSENRGWASNLWQPEVTGYPICRHALIETSKNLPLLWNQQWNIMWLTTCHKEIWRLLVPNQRGRSILNHGENNQPVDKPVEFGVSNRQTHKKNHLDELLVSVHAPQCPTEINQSAAFSYGLHGHPLITRQKLQFFAGYWHHDILGFMAIYNLNAIFSYFDTYPPFGSPIFWWKTPKLLSPVNPYLWDCYPSPVPDSAHWSPRADPALRVGGGPPLLLTDT